MLDAQLGAARGAVSPLLALARIFRRTSCCECCYTNANSGDLEAARWKGQAIGLHDIFGTRICLERCEDEECEYAIFVGSLLPNYRDRIPRRPQRGVVAVGDDKIGRMALIVGLKAPRYGIIHTLDVQDRPGSLALTTTIFLISNPGHAPSSFSFSIHTSAFVSI